MRTLLDGDPLPGYDHRVTAQGQIERKDFSGESSSTAAGHGGWKPWLLAVRVRVDFERPDELLALRVMFQAEDKGLPRLWEITDETAVALGIYTVRFSEAMQVEPDAEQHRWEVTLHLVEEGSNPEKSAERRPAATEATPAAPDATDTAGAPAAASGAWGTVESILSRANALFGKLFFDVPAKSSGGAAP